MAHVDYLRPGRWLAAALLSLAAFWPAWASPEVIDAYPAKKFFPSMDRIEAMDPNEINLIDLGYYIRLHDARTPEGIQFWVKGERISQAVQLDAYGRVLNPPDMTLVDEDTTLFVLYDGPRLADGSIPPFEFQWTARLQPELAAFPSMTVRTETLLEAIAQTNHAIGRQAGARRLFAPKIRRVAFELPSPEVSAQAVTLSNERIDLPMENGRAVFDSRDARLAQAVLIHFSSPWRRAELIE